VLCSFSELEYAVEAALLYSISVQLRYSSRGASITHGVCVCVCVCCVEHGVCLFASVLHMLVRLCTAFLCLLYEVRFM